MKRIIISLLAMLLLLPTAQSRTRKKQPVQPPTLSTIEIITKVNDYWQQTHKPEVRSFWDEAAYHTGNMEAYRLLGTARWLDYSTTWARHNRGMGAQEQDPAKWKYKNYGEGHDYVLFGDWQICFQTYLDLYRFEVGDLRFEISDAPNLKPQISNLKPQTSNLKPQTSNHKTARAIEVMDYEVRQPQTDFWWWADALYMVMPVFAKLYKTTGEVKYLDKLYDNYRWADELMYDSVEQLYYRDAKYIYPKVKTASGGKSFWARGDGWVLAGLAKVLADMPQDYRHRPFFEQRFRELAEGVARVQRPGGYWSRSMLCEEDAPGPETSGTAFFTYGMLWGVNHGLLERDKYVPVIDKAWKYLTTTALQEDGSVGFVQPIGEKPDPTKTVDARSQANFGVGAFLLAACEHLRFEETTLQTLPTGRGVVTLSIENPTSEFRQQVVEVEAKELFRRLGIQGGRQFVILDPAQLEIPYQLSYDGKVLIDAGVSPHSTLTLTAQKGTPKTYPTVCFGQLYPERKDDYAWENDRGAYRAYGPALQRTGERSYGIDVWSKNTPELVVEQRYWTEDVVMMPTVERLRRENRHYGDSVYRTISYHHDHGRGMDLYRVGATLGCGTPALIKSDGELQYPYCFEKCVILDNGPLRTTVQLLYGTTSFGTDSIAESRIISLDKGSNFCRMTVNYNGLTKPARLASGVALHSEAYGGKADETADRIIAKDFVAYADPTDNPRVNSCQLFVATLYPQGDVETMKQLFDKPHDGSEGHLLGIHNNYKGEPYTYYFGSAWSKNDVRTMQEWQQRIEWTLRSLRQPLTVKIED